ncbi:hypothetical protein JVT61DRAFT_7356 [Boletus reticuloceps]|uniref:Oxidoreductase AflY n=1 Tax=Boletus reticuloceps TaxID=495285 RepID=A0A8I2YIA8_9AGAM|nr:hypothetical protein JVT61DRAFT_7356 [Boletus reticuloceps]
MSSSSEYDPDSNRPFHRPGEDPTHLPPEALTARGLADYSPKTAATVGGPQTRPPLDKLFNAPPLPPSAFSPRTFPGIDQASTQALIETLSDNHVRWHIFFNYKGFHNHAAHHILAIWALGAPGPVIEAAYATHCEYQRPAFAAPGPINKPTFNKHLGDERYYAGYLDYFSSELLQKGLKQCLEEFFASEANFGTAFPEMLSRFVAGFLHPFIHVGYGAEFSSIGISAEGLAMAAVHPSSPDLLPRVWFPDVVSGVNTRGGNRTALSIVALVSCDPRLSQIKHMDEEMMCSKILTEHGSIIHDYVNMWKFDISTEDGIADAIEELSWANDLIYGVGGYSTDKPFSADFFLMHLVTSSIFLPSLLASIDKFSSRRLLLMAYFTSALSYYVARGRPRLDIRSFYKSTENLVHEVPGPKTEPVSGTLPTPTSDLAQTPNAWYPMIQTTIIHPNEHLCKTQRALAHHSSLYGTRKKGWCVPPEGRTVTAAQVVREEEAEDKVGLQELDGTIFVRLAMLTQNRLGWMREGETAGEWDFEGFYWKPEESASV